MLAGARARSVGAPVSSDLEPSDSQAPTVGTVALPGGEFSMGNDASDGYPGDGEGPVHTVVLSTFAIDACAVTNALFAEFVEATGHVSEAERFGSSLVFRGLLPGRWREVEGADWRHPEGPQSDLGDREHHPVVHVSWNDAQAFCAWSGTRLPTEAEWEYAARGGLDGSVQGENASADDSSGTVPVDADEPNGYGLYNMTGNVWEWCSDWFDPGYYASSREADPRGPAWGTQRVMRGGSYACRGSHRRRCRVDARGANEPNRSTGDLGFRVVR
jgi:formylglycine-generating enzyme